MSVFSASHDIPAQRGGGVSHEYIAFIDRAHLLHNFSYKKFCENNERRYFYADCLPFRYSCGILYSLISNSSVYLVLGTLTKKLGKIPLKYTTIKNLDTDLVHRLRIIIRAFRVFLLKFCVSTLKKVRPPLKVRISWTSKKTEILKEFLRHLGTSQHFRLFSNNLFPQKILNLRIFSLV